MYYLILQFKMLSDTRWVERHTNMSELLLIHPYVVKAISVMTGSTWDTKTIAEAQGLNTYLTQLSFIVPFVISEHMLGYTKQLSIKLQGWCCQLTVLNILSN